MILATKLFKFKWGVKDANAIQDSIYSLASLAIILIAAGLLIYLITKWVIPLSYKLIYRNYLVVTEENYVVVDVRIYSRKDERLIVENEDMDRFMMWEHKYDLAVTGDVLVGYKEVNTKTGMIRYFYNKEKVFYKKEKGG